MACAHQRNEMFESGETYVRGKIVLELNAREFLPGRICALVNGEVSPRSPSDSCLALAFKMYINSAYVLQENTSIVLHIIVHVFECVRVLSYTLLSDRLRGAPERWMKVCEFLLPHDKSVMSKIATVAFVNWGLKPVVSVKKTTEILPCVFGSPKGTGSR